MDETVNVFRQERTEKLELHWSGFWYCNDCSFYTGQPENHPGHDLEPIPPAWVWFTAKDVTHYGCKKF